MLKKSLTEPTLLEMSGNHALLSLRRQVKLLVRRTSCSYDNSRRLAFSAAHAILEDLSVDEGATC